MDGISLRDKILQLRSCLSAMFVGVLGSVLMSSPIQVRKQKNHVKLPFNRERIGISLQRTQECVITCIGLNRNNDPHRCQDVENVGS